jgi:hypothetical protein
MTLYDELQNKVKYVILNIGDIIVDNIGGHIGILTKRNRHIDMVEDDIFVWEVKWINNTNKDCKLAPDDTLTLLEEEGLKFSIIVGTYEWHSIDGETYEL